MNEIGIIHEWMRVSQALAISSHDRSFTIRTLLDGTMERRGQTTYPRRVSALDILFLEIVVYQTHDTSHMVMCLVHFQACRVLYCETMAAAYGRVPAGSESPASLSRPGCPIRLNLATCNTPDALLMGLDTLQSDFVGANETIVATTSCIFRHHDHRAIPCPIWHTPAIKSTCSTSSRHISPNCAMTLRDTLRK